MAAQAGPALGGDNDGDDEPIDVTLARLGITPVPNNTVANAEVAGGAPPCGRGGGELLDWLRVYYINLDARPDRSVEMLLWSRGPASFDGAHRGMPLLANVAVLCCAVQAGTDGSDNGTRWD